MTPSIDYAIHWIIATSIQLKCKLTVKTLALSKITAFQYVEHGYRNFKIEIKILGTPITIAIQ